MAGTVFCVLLMQLWLVILYACLFLLLCEVPHLFLIALADAVFAVSLEQIWLFISRACLLLRLCEEINLLLTPLGLLHHWPAAA